MHRYEDVECLCDVRECMYIAFDPRPWPSSVLRTSDCFSFASLFSFRVGFRDAS